MESNATAMAPRQAAGATPSNPPPQRRAINRSVSGMIGGDPSRNTLSPLLTGGYGRKACAPVFVIAAF